MGMLVHNGRLIAGTLPLAQVYEFDGDAQWRLLTRLDHTPDVRYRRAWTMAEHAGQVFCSTLPSGRVFSWRAGRVAMARKPLTDGWHSVTAVRAGSKLEIYVDAELVGRESSEEIAEFDLTNGRPLLIGHGPNASFHGDLSHVAPADDFTITDYGATANDATDDTQAINATLAACKEAGGGTVIIPTGTFVVSRQGSESPILEIPALTTVRGDGDGSILKFDPAVND
ncbi:Uncharacterized protein SCF082_LOCUS34074, partial [Durusdinium trenchii]